MCVCECARARVGSWVWNRTNHNQFNLVKLRPTNQMNVNKTCQKEFFCCAIRFDSIHIIIHIHRIYSNLYRHSCLYFEYRSSFSIWSLPESIHIFSNDTRQKWRKQRTRKREWPWAWVCPVVQKWLLEQQ